MKENINRIKEAQKVTIVGFIVNLILCIGKITAGIVGRSAAMLADGIHSLSDFVTDVIVIVFIRLSGKASDDRHAYGHGKYETFATLLISVALFIVGAGIVYDSLSKIIKGLKGEILPEPGIIALWAAIISIIAKEILFRYTKRVGEKIESQAVIANGWHHRSDAFSSIGTALGISGAIFLGEKWRILDPIAGFVVSIFILKVAYDLAKPSYDELLESALPEKTCNVIKEIIESDPKVRDFHKLRTRKIGTYIAVDVHVMLDNDLSFESAHEITRTLEKRLKNRFGANMHINIHAEPFYDRRNMPCNKDLFKKN